MYLLVLVIPSTSNRNDTASIYYLLINRSWPQLQALGTKYLTQWPKQIDIPNTTFLLFWHWTRLYYDDSLRVTVYLLSGKKTYVVNSSSNRAHYYKILQYTAINTSKPSRIVGHRLVFIVPKVMGTYLQHNP